MSYSIKAILHDKPNTAGLHKIRLQVIQNRIIKRVQTAYAVAKNQFINGQVKNHTNATKINANIRKQISDIETRLLDELRAGPITKERFNSIAEGSQVSETAKVDLREIADEFIETINQTKSEGYYKHVRCSVNRFLAWRPMIKPEEINKALLTEFEIYLRNEGLKNITIHANIKKVELFLNHLEEIEVYNMAQKKGYKKPTFTKGNPVYLTEEETAAFADIVKTIKSPGHKLAGYYFLLSCNTGYRISDAKRFNYNKNVIGDKIVLRAKKNGNLVSIPIHSRLKEVLEFVKENPLTLSEQKTREYVKDIAKIAGINRNVIFHSGRHTWAMLLMSKDFTQDQVAETLGDSKDVARVYARVHNEYLNKKIIDKLG